MRPSALRDHLSPETPSAAPSASDPLRGQNWGTAGFLAICSKQLNRQGPLSIRNIWWLIVPLAMASTYAQLMWMEAWLATRSSELDFVQPPARTLFVSRDLIEINNPEPPSPNRQANVEPEPPQPEKQPPQEEIDHRETKQLPLAVEQLAQLKSTPKDKATKRDKKPAQKQTTPPAAPSQARFDLTPLYRPKPSYPTSARRNRVEGYVLVRYTIARSGDVTQIGIVSATPPGVFEAAALEAVRRWRYPPQPVERSGMQTRISFVLRGNS